MSWRSGTRLQCQTTNNPLFSALKNQTTWLLTGTDPNNIAKLLHPFRRISIWNNNRIMRNCLLPHLQRAISERDKSGGPKTINNLAVTAYLNEVNTLSTGRIDSHFINVAIAQLKVFLFAGHDTTASALCYAHHLLSTNPKTLATTRAEHDAVFGPDPSQTAAKIKDTPHLLNQLPYTSAVIKEALRLFPPVGTIRTGQPNFFLTHPDAGVRYPTDGFMLFACSFAEQRNSQFWHRPDEFVPERWSAKEGDLLHVRKNAFRPFELGPRNCIGQELALLELRAILALTLRELDVQSAYLGDGPRVLGELGFQVMGPKDLTSHPNGGMPVRVRVR